MIREFDLRHWLGSRPLRGRSALVVGIVAVGLPTALLAYEANFSCAFIGPYIPFILISAVLLGWVNAALVASASAFVDDALFVGAPNRLLEGPHDFFALGVFLVISGMLIGFVELVRQAVRSGPGSGRAQPSGIIFSLEDGRAWASWPGSRVPLGPQEEVADMMEDFLAQIALAERLNKATASA